MELVKAGIKSRITGCVLGGLIGDALGAPWEFFSTNFLDKIVGYYFEELMTKPVPEIRKYTDDTAMTISVLEFLISYQHINMTDLAKKFYRSYTAEKYRGYAATIGPVFDKLVNSNFVEVFQPAKEQFNGEGSYGNGAAMRISPLGLYFVADDMKEFFKNVVDSCRITHAHRIGICGGIFQAIAVREAFVYGIENELTNYNDIPTSPKLKILNLVEERIKAVAQGQYGMEEYTTNGMDCYLEKLVKIREIIGSEQTSLEYIRSQLGNGVEAQDSVVTAFYCFLAGFDPIQNIKSESHFQRTIQFATSLGGDTDTIASMSGAIAGAYLGVDRIPSELVRHCEAHEYLQTLAQKLYTKVEGKLLAYFTKEQTKSTDAQAHL